MIFKTKKISLKNKLPNILSFLKNLFAVIFSIQIIVFTFLLIWYFNNPIKTIYTPKRILDFGQSGHVDLTFTLRFTQDVDQNRDATLNDIS